MCTDNPHLLMDKTGHNVFICKICDLNFPTLQTLNEHFNLKHPALCYSAMTGEPPQPVVTVENDEDDFTEGTGKVMEMAKVLNWVPRNKVKPGLLVFINFICTKIFLYNKNSLFSLRKNLMFFTWNCCILNSL